MPDQNNEIIKQSQEKNKKYQHEYKDIFAQHIKGQSPKIAILTCADSRVIPEFIFHATLGELFVIRVAGNIAVDETVIASLEYAVDHLAINHLIILGHTHCGAVKAAEESPDSKNLLIQEIRNGFHNDEQNHIKANLTHQVHMLPKRSLLIDQVINKGNLQLLGAIYHLEDGHVEFISLS